MGKNKNQYNPESLKNKGNSESIGKANKIGPSTPHELTRDRITAFGGAFSLVKFFDVVGFKEIFESTFQEPKRKPKQGCYSMLVGLILLLFIGFSRIWHFKYLQLDPMLCGILDLSKLHSPSTYWRFLDSMGLNQSFSILKTNAILRERVWQLCGFNFKEIHVDIDTTVETVYGEIEGSRKGHNTKNRGKKGMRPILAYIEETREYLHGKLRKGTTVSGEEMGKFVRSLKDSIPSCVEKVTLRGDGEFISEEGCLSAEEAGYDYIFGNKSCKPPFNKKDWYGVGRKSSVQYNSCEYKPGGWSKDRRFVAMRIPKHLKETETSDTQLELFEDDNFKYRIFVTSKKGRPHKVVQEYDKRADCENLVGESKREGLAAFPSKKFKNNHVFFQIVMLSFNIWKHLKFLAAKSQIEQMKKISRIKKSRRKKFFLKSKSWNILLSNIPPGLPGSNSSFLEPKSFNMTTELKSDIPCMILEWKNSEIFWIIWMFLEMEKNRGILRTLGIPFPMRLKTKCKKFLAGKREKNDENLKTEKFKKKFS